MSWRLVISGGRDFENEDRFFDAMEELAVAEWWPVEIIQGDCPTGADRFARKLARHLDLNLKAFPADWRTYGPAAGPIRNEEMMRYATDGHERSSVLIAFWDGKSRGTKNAIDCALAHGMEVHVYRY